ncbi:cytochrome P450 [Nereida sp. MMG025]|uniref:cytochrome P450 n=1 Tax=Nereida sp. MMG025 TaxID=2909981 RepID=UPI001F3C5AC3|nr:cytochrome P450 [Nereida sp. MMG025]MCF6445933.1 cytochrome P450 [Nereida sp. MMG025]
MTNRYPVRCKLVTEPIGIWQTLQTARRNLIEIIPDIATKQPIVSGKTAIVRWHMVMDPDALRRVLKEEVDNYPKSDVTKNILEPAIGDSLFIAEGAHWRWQRRAATPVFTHRNIANLAPVMSMAADRSVERIAANAGRALDMFEEMVATTFDVISDVTFSGDNDFDSDAVHRAIDGYIAQTAKVSLFDIVGVPTWVPRLNRIGSSGPMKEMRQVADGAIERRRETGPSDVPDLLDLLLEGEDPKTKRQMNTAELRDNLLTFIVAGHETTALTLAWALYLCAFDPEVQDKARAEAQSVLDGRTATAEDVPNLKYIRQIVDEALRLYPPAAFLSRTAQKDDRLVDREIRAGDTVTMPIYALHRNALLWDDPDAFNPDRFADPKAINRFAYLPFGDGPRICIGASFALQEAVIILATLLARFRFSSVKGRNPTPELILTLRPSGGVWLEIEDLLGAQKAA